MKKKSIDIIDLHNHYSGKRKIQEHKHMFIEADVPLYKSYIAGTQAGVFEKTKPVVVMDEIMLNPVSFEIICIFNIEFHINKIKDDFFTLVSKNDLDDDDFIDDRDVEKYIDKQISSKDNNINTRKGMKKQFDSTEFYWDIFKKNLTTGAFSHKIKDEIRHGRINMEGYELTGVTAATTMDDEVLYAKLENSIKKNKSANFQKYGIAIAIASEDSNEINTMDNPKDRKATVFNFSKEFTKSFEDFVLNDTEYYTIYK